MEITNIESFLKYYESVRKRTTRVIETIPADKIDWTPKTGFFTFGDLIRHIAAIERYTFAENARGNWSKYPGCDRSLADGYEEVRRFFDRMHAETVGILSGLTAEDLKRDCTTPAGTKLATWKWLRALVEHEIHHRGQMYLMLNLCEVDRPRLYGLTSEEVLARSSVDSL
jgi:uncharacterized damage-inducible protein DinB